MPNTPFGWRPGDHVPIPPPDTNGWGRWVTASIIHLSTTTHFLEKTQDRHSDHIASGAPTTKPPATWSDKRELAKDIASIAKDVRTGLMWIAAIILLLGLIAKKLDLTQLPTLKSWLGTLG